MRCLEGSKFYKLRQGSVPKLVRAICAECKAHSVQELTEMREKKTKMQLKEGLKPGGGNWTKCARDGCNKDLGPGPRWWVCSVPYCRRECRSVSHQSWAREEQGDGKIVGDEVV
jgi:hypothetical protein